MDFDLEEYDDFDEPYDLSDSGSESGSKYSKEECDPVNDRLGHVVAVWRDLTLIWGGFSDGKLNDDQETSGRPIRKFCWSADADNRPIGNGR